MGDTLVADDTTLTPLGVLLEQHRGSVSKREAARRAGISEGRWRQIVTGQQKAGGGVVVPVNPRRETVIAMAEAVKANIDEALRLAGMEPRDHSAPSGDSRLPPSTSGMTVSQDAATAREMVEDEVTEAIRRSPLMERARQHLLAQYDMLRELSEFSGSDEAKPDPAANLPRLRPGQVTRPARAAARRGKPDKP